MNQTAAMIIGAIAGGLAWAVLYPYHHTPGLFVCVISAGWAAIGLRGLFQGQLMLAGRGGKNAKELVGLSARLVGCAVVISGLAFTAAMSLVASQ